MSDRIPNFRSINGEGQPRIILRKVADFWTSFGTLTFGATSVTEAKGGTVSITGSNAANNTLTVGIGHGFVVGYRVEVAGTSGYTPDINREHTVTATDATTITIDTDFTVAGTGGTVRRVPDYRSIRAGMRIVAYDGRTPLPDLECYARITAVDNVNKILTFSGGWVGGTPDLGPFSVNGYVVDLPFSQGIEQVFAPEQLIHSIFRKRLKSKFFGYNYGVTIAYDRWIAADTLYALTPVLNAAETDEIVVVPHIDKPGYNYAVVWDGAIQVRPFGIAGGHAGVAFQFRGKALVQFPSNPSGYGFNYAYNYGVQK